MQETRRARLQAVILEEMATVVPREIKDPRVGSLTFTEVRVTPDGSQATVMFTLLGADPESPETERRSKETQEGLQSAAGFLRRHLAGVLTVRHIPTLVFKADRGFENVQRVSDILKQISSEKPASGATDGDSSKE